MSRQDLPNLTCKENWPPLSSSFKGSSIQPNSNKSNQQDRQLQASSSDVGTTCRVLFSIKHGKDECPQVNRPVNLPLGTKVYDAIYDLVSKLENWPQNKQYVIDMVHLRNKEWVEKDALVAHCHNYFITMLTIEKKMIKVYLKVNDLEPKWHTVIAGSSVLELITLTVSNIADIKRLEKYDSQFATFVDCEAGEEVENDATYAVQIEFFNSNENSEFQDSTTFSDTTSSSIAFAKPSDICYPDLSKMHLHSKSPEPEFAYVQKYQPIDESKNIKRFPTSKSARIGALFDFMDDKVKENVFDSEEFQGIKNAIVEKDEKEEISVKFFKNCKTFSDRCECLSIKGLQKITALTEKQPGIFDFLISPISENLRYCSVVLTYKKKTYKLNTENESLRDRLAHTDFGLSTHILTSLTEGLTYVFLIGLPQSYIDDVGSYQVEKNIRDIFNGKGSAKLSSMYFSKISVFQNSNSTPVKPDMTFGYIQELVNKLNTDPNVFSNEFKAISWEITPLNLFQPSLKMQCPIEMSNGLLDQSIELLVEIERRLDAYELLMTQVNEYDRIFSKAEFDKCNHICKSEKSLLTKTKRNLVTAIFQHRQGQLSDEDFFIKLSQFCHNSKELPDDQFEHMYFMEEKIKEVVQWEKSGLFFIGDDEFEFINKIIAPVAYVLVYENKNAMEFSQNLKHMKTLPSDVNRILLDLNLLHPEKIPINFTGILKFERGELVDMDVLRSFNFRLRSSVARCPKSALRNDLIPSAKLSNLEIPCPSCAEEDCFWSCDRCLRPLQYDWDGFLCCECGMAPVEQFEFWCKNHRKHGETYVPFHSDQLEDALERLRSFKDKTILILGQTGVGKSTWINSIAHYLTYGSLDDALEGEPMYLVPSSFTIVDEKSNQTYKKLRIVVGEENDTESFKQGESATRAPKIHSFDYKGGKLMLIDTPGVGDTRGFEQDKKNFAMTLDYISSFKEIHGICILLKPNEARLTPSLRYCISQLFSQLHRNAAKNIVFCLTNTQGTLYKPGETFTALEEFLGELHQNRGINMELTQNTIYCMDNCAFRYLCAKRQGVQFDDNVHANYVEAWNKSWSETYRFIKHITDVKPHSASETATLNEARRIILSLAKPLALITKEIQLNVSYTEKHKISVQGLTGDEKDFQSKLKIKRYYVKADPLPYPRTVCVDKSCTEVKKDREGNNLQVFNKLCHPHCYLTGVTLQTYPNEALIHCAAMGGTQSCQLCYHSWNTHMHINWSHTEECEDVDDESVKRDLQYVAEKKKAKLDTIRKCEQLINDYKHEQKLINTIAARFAAFLQANAIILYNDAIKEYIHIEINNAKIEAAITNDFSKVEGLQRALDEYMEERRVIQEHVDESKACNSAADLAFELEDIRTQFDTLYNLPLTGGNIKKMLDLEMSGQQKQLEYQLGHFNTHDRRSKANDRHNYRPKDPVVFNNNTIGGDYSRKSKRDGKDSSSSSRSSFYNTLTNPGRSVLNMICPDRFRPSFMKGK